MMKGKIIDHQEQRFSIRKYSFGAASVLIACVFFLGGQQVLAEEQVNSACHTESSLTAVDQQTSSETVTNTSVTNPPTPVNPTPAASQTTSQEEKDTQTQAKTSIPENKTAPEAKEVVSPVPSSNNSTPNSSLTTSSSPQEKQTKTSEQTTQLTNPAPLQDQKNEKTVNKPKTVAATAKTNKVQTAKTMQQAKTVTTSLPASGHYSFKKKTAVKNEPKLSSPTQFFFAAGQKIFYDKVLEKDGYQWLSYLSYSGIRRYAPIATSSSVKQAVKSTGTSQQTLPAQGTYHFTQKADVKNEAKLSSPTQFSFYKGDQVYYDKVLEADGYQWLSYVSYSGKRRYVALTAKSQSQAKTSSTKPTTSTLPAQGTYRFSKQVSVKSEAKMSSPNLFNFKQGDSIYYDKVLQADGHQWLSYVSYSGVRRYIVLN